MQAAEALVTGEAAHHVTPRGTISANMLPWPLHADYCAKEYVVFHKKYIIKTTLCKYMCCFECTM